MKTRLFPLLALLLLLAPAIHAAEHDWDIIQRDADDVPRKYTLTLTPDSFLDVDSDGHPRIRTAAQMRTGLGLGATDDVTFGTADLDGLVLAGHTLQVAANFAQAGAGPLTLTTTGTTNATVPAGTVTLADLATSQSLTNKSINGITLAGSGTLNVGSGGTLGSAAFTATSAYDAAGAASAAQAAAATDASNKVDAFAADPTGNGSYSPLNWVAKLNKPAASITSAFDPASLTFSIKQRIPIYGFLDEGFIMGAFEWLDSRGTPCLWGTTNDTRADSGVFTQGATSSAIPCVWNVTNPFVAPFCGVELPINQPFIGATAKLRLGFGKGLTADLSGGTQSEIACEYNMAANTISFRIYKGTGSPTIDGAVSAPTGPFTLGFSIADCSLNIWVKQPGKEWRVVAARVLDATTEFDIIAASEWTSSQWMPFAAFEAPSVSQTLKIGKMRWGYLRGVGIANPSPLKYEDGTPIAKGNRRYFIANAAHYAASSDQSVTIPCSTLCVWSIDVTAPWDLKKEAIVFTKRAGPSSGVTRLYGENSGDWTWDLQTGKAVWLISNWGSRGESDYTIRLYKYSSNAFPTGVVLLDNPTEIVRPGGTGGYDACLVRINGIWNMSLRTEGAAIYTSPDLVTWTEKWKDTTERGGGINEGTKLYHIGGNWTFWASAGADSFALWDFATGAYVAARQVVGNVAISSIPAHPCFFPYKVGNTTRLFCVSFDSQLVSGAQSYGWGDLTVIDCPQTQAGDDYPTYLVPVAP